MVKCPKCGAPMLGTAQRCNKCKADLQAAPAPESAAQTPSCPVCGAELQPRWKVCPECGSAVPPAIPVCRKCGAELKPHWKACPECGTPVNAPETTPEPAAVRTEAAPEQQARQTPAASERQEPEQNAPAPQPQVPPAAQSEPDADMERYYISKDFRQSGPFSKDKLIAMLKDGLISLDFFASRDGSSDWKPIGDVIPAPAVIPAQTDAAVPAPAQTVDPVNAPETTPEPAAVRTEAAPAASECQEPKQNAPAPQPQVPPVEAAIKSAPRINALKDLSTLSVVFYGWVLLLARPSQEDIYFGNAARMLLLALLCAWSVFYSIFALVQSAKYKKRWLTVSSILAVCFCQTNSAVLFQAAANMWGTYADSFIYALYILHLFFALCFSIAMLVWSAKQKKPQQCLQTRAETSAQPEKPFLRGGNILLFTALCNGAGIALFLTIMHFFISPDEIGFIVVTLIVVTLNFYAWRKNNTPLTLIAGIAYIASGLGALSGILCFIGFARRNKHPANKDG